MNFLACVFGWCSICFQYLHSFSALTENQVVAAVTGVITLMLPMAF